MLELLVKFKNEECQDFKFVDDKSDWIDLKSAENVKLNKGDFKLINLGFSLELPSGYEAHILPRSSTYKNHGIIQANSMGIIDNSYSGNEDYWMYPVIALRDTVIKKGDRICQFRIMKMMEKVRVRVVDTLNNPNRGGFGSTGV